jgi:hypothetical protein
LPLRLRLGEHRWLLLLFGGQDLELFLLFSNAHRQLLGTLAGGSSAVGAPVLRCRVEHRPTTVVEGQGVLELIIPAGLRRCLRELPSGLS